MGEARLRRERGLGLVVAEDAEQAAHLVHRRRARCSRRRRTPRARARDRGPRAASPRPPGSPSRRARGRRGLQLARDAHPLLLGRALDARRALGLEPRRPLAQGAVELRAAADGAPHRDGGDDEQQGSLAQLTRSSSTSSSATLPVIPATSSTTPAASPARPARRPSESPPRAAREREVEVVGEGGVEGLEPDEGAHRDRDRRDRVAAAQEDGDREREQQQRRQAAVVRASARRAARAETRPRRTAQRPLGDTRVERAPAGAEADPGVHTAQRNARTALPRRPACRSHVLLEDDADRHVGR